MARLTTLGFKDGFAVIGVCRADCENANRADDPNADSFHKSSLLTL
jgi:hypothetical protein